MDTKEVATTSTPGNGSGVGVQCAPVRISSVISSCLARVVVGSVWAIRSTLVAAVRHDRVSWWSRVVVTAVWGHISYRLEIIDVSEV